MKRPRLAAVAAAALLATALAPFARATTTERTYTNPVTPVGVADPGVLYYRGEYYLYATAGLDPVHVWRSTGLATWTDAGPVLYHATSGGWDARDVWAPEVAYENGVFVMYYTGTSDGTDATRRVGFATSTSPLGPFTSGGPITAPFSIDPHPFRDPLTGREYLYYNGPMPQNQVDDMPSPGTLAGSPQVVTHTTFDWEQIWNEAPWSLERDGTYYVFYSAGCFCDASYSVSYATSSAPKGAAWTKAPENPILRSTRFVEGPGHNSVVTGPGGVEPWFVYHGRVPGAPVDARSVRVDRLYWNHDRPFLLGPTAQETTRPDPGTFRDLFDGADTSGLGQTWTTSPGSIWSVATGAAASQGSGGSRQWALPRAEPASSYVFDVWVSPEEGDSGVAAWRAGDGDEVYALLDPVSKSLVVEGALGGEALTPFATPLPSGFDFAAYHELRVTKNESLFDFDLDGVRLASRSLSTGAGLPGLATRDGMATFDGAVYSIASEDFFDRLATTWRDAPGAPKTGSWSVADGALRQSDATVAARAFKGEPSTSYETSVDVRATGVASDGALAGLYVAYAGDDDYVRAAIDPVGRRLVIESTSSGGASNADAIPLATDFDASAFHTIRATRDGSRFEIYLDGLPVASRSVDLPASVVGLSTQGTAAEFDDASIRRVNAPLNLALDPSFEVAAAGGTSPWIAVDSAAPTGGDAHSLSSGGTSQGGELVQVVRDLEPGATYVVTAWLRGPKRGFSQLVADGPDGPVGASVKKKKWREVTITFRAPTSGETNLRFHASRASGSIDDVYVRKQ